MCVRVCVSMCACVCVHVHACVCTCACVCVYVCVLDKCLSVCLVFAHNLNSKIVFLLRAANCNFFISSPDAPQFSGRKEIFYLTMHSTHFIYGYMASDIIIVKDHSDSQKVYPLPTLHGLLISVRCKGSPWVHHEGLI